MLSPPATRTHGTLRALTTCAWSWVNRTASTDVAFGALLVTLKVVFSAENNAAVAVKLRHACWLCAQTRPENKARELSSLQE